MPDGTCPICGSADLPKRATGPRATYCSTSCRRRAGYLARKAIGKHYTPKVRQPKQCPQCEATFTPERTAKQRFCSSKCAKNYTNAAWRAKRGTCSEPDCTNLVVSRGLCRRHHPAGPSWSNGTPETRRANLRRKTQRRRALLSDPEAEDIDRDEIGDRDGWRCGICAQRVGKAYQWPHPRSASLDHIEPLSLGGRHTRTNVQLAHLGCNLAKSNRGDGDQLALIG